MPRRRNFRGAFTVRDCSRIDIQRVNLSISGILSFLKESVFRLVCTLGSECNQDEFALSLRPLESLAAGETAQVPVISTLLQRGVLRRRRTQNRFNGFYGLLETAAALRDPYVARP